MAGLLSEEDLHEVYAWVDQIPLSRPKRNIARDFADGVLTSEIVKHFYPKLVDLHNYSPTNSVSQKQYNWSTLNQKVFRKMGFAVSQDDIDAVVNCDRGAIERVLHLLKAKLAEYAQHKSAKKLSKLAVAQANPAGVSTKSPRKEKASRPSVVPDRAPASTVLPDVGQSPRRPHPQQQQQQPQPPQQQQPQAQPYSEADDSRARGTVLPHLRPDPVQDDSQDGRSPTEIIEQQRQTIQELRETIEILQLKIQKLDQLVRIKDSKVEMLTNKLRELQGDT